MGTGSGAAERAAVMEVTDIHALHFPGESVSPASNAKTCEYCGGRFRRGRTGYHDACIEEWLDRREHGMCTACGERRATHEYCCNACHAAGSPAWRGYRGARDRWTCRLCGGRVPPGEPYLHDECNREWHRRAWAGRCVMCKTEAVARHLCGGCISLGPRGVYVGYAGR